jgi:O-antigen/teichoic acid export membrane protein
VRRSAARFGVATVGGHASQLVWLAAAVRVMTPAAFGSVLAAQALYAVLQVVIDVGTNGVGSRMAARGELDDVARGQIVRMRVGLALAATPPAVALGALKVSGSLAATLPFIAALFLFAALNVWEPYGAGDARPWATYTFLRSALLAVPAAGFLVAGGRFPMPLAGALECLAIVVVMLAFGRGPLPGLRLAARARGGPWRPVFAIGAPAFTAQTSVAAGTLVLSGAGSPAKAGIFAACVRLLTGINAIAGVVATSLYPRLARGAAEGSAGDREVVGVALRLIALIAGAATAFCALLGRAVAVAFLGDSSRATIAALILTMAAALPLGNTVLFTSAMVARRHERATLVPFMLGGALTIGLAIAAVALAGPRADLVAAALLIGQSATMAGLGIRAGVRCPDLAQTTRQAMAVALLVALLACASLVPGAALPAGLALLGVAAASLVRLRPLARSLLGDAVRLRRRREPPAAQADDRL